MLPHGACSYPVHARDDGKTWGEPSLICINGNETALAALPNGDLLAVVRREQMGKTLWSTISQDGGFTYLAVAVVWSAAELAAMLG